MSDRSDIARTFWTLAASIESRPCPVWCADCDGADLDGSLVHWTDTNPLSEGGEISACAGQELGQPAAEVSFYIHAGEVEFRTAEQARAFGVAIVEFVDRITAATPDGHEPQNR